MSGNKAEKLAALTENQSNILQRFYEHWKNSNVYWKVGSAVLGSILCKLECTFKSCIIIL
jgi:hypothetical protein